MKHAASVFFLLLNFIGVVKAQHDYTKEYYPFINQAELQIIDGKYDDSQSMFVFVFARLIKEGWLTLDELEGLDRAKVSKVSLMTRM